MRCQKCKSRVRVQVTRHDKCDSCARAKQHYSHHAFLTPLVRCHGCLRAAPWYGICVRHTRYHSSSTSMRACQSTGCTLLLVVIAKRWIPAPQTLSSRRYGVRESNTSVVKHHRQPCLRSQELFPVTPVTGLSHGNYCGPPNPLLFNSISRYIYIHLCLVVPSLLSSSQLTIWLFRPSTIY